MKTLTCNFQLFGMMPPCVLPAGHKGNHSDGFGASYGRAEGMEIQQIPGSKELRYVPRHELPKEYRHD